MIGVAVIWLGAASALDWYGQRTVDVAGWDAIVVAGCRVLPDGQPSPALARRTEHAVDLWRRGLAPRIVFTGGVGDFPPAEAVAASNLALELGVPAGAIALEERSTSTEENAANAAALLGGGRVLVVSDTYHIFRCERVFGRYFDEVRGAGSAPILSYRVRGALREVAAVSWYKLKRRI